MVTTVLIRFHFFGAKANDENRVSYYLLFLNYRKHAKLKNTIN